MYFQVMMLMNIRTKYLALVSAIQKDWKVETTNLIETVLQIIRHFEFMKGNEKSNEVVLQTSTSKPSARLRHSPAVPKRLCKNQECIDKSLTIHHTDCCSIKHPKLRQKYALNRMSPRDSQKILKAQDG